MTVWHGAVQVRIEAGVLWVGSDAYPLRNISHVGCRGLPPARRDSNVARNRLDSQIKSTAITGSILSVITMGGLLFPTAALLIWMVWRRNKLPDLPDLHLPALHGLIISTAGTQRDAVWSTAKDEIDYLIREITAAIGNPDNAQTVIYVEHAVSGDVIHQWGANSVGKANHFGSGNISAGW
ncbi:DUF6232 family protein [Streptosporangium sp. NPDC004631]